MYFNSLNYKDYSISTLYFIYRGYPKERKEIELHISTRSEEERKEFFNLKNQNNLTYYFRNVLREGRRVAELSKDQLNKANKFKEYDLAEYKRNLDLVLKSMVGNEIGIRNILYEEAVNQNEKLIKLQEEYKGISYQEDKSFYFKCISEIGKCIEYIHQLQSKSHNEIIEQISKYVPDAVVENFADPTIANTELLLKYGPFPAEQPQIVFVFFIYYLQKAGIAEIFTEKKIKKEIEELTSMYNRTPNSFYNKYLKINKRDYRVSKTNYKSIEAVIPLLNDYPEAKALAINDLKNIKNV